MIDPLSILKSIRFYWPITNANLTMCHFFFALEMFKGFDKVDTVQYIYTSIHESLCGVKLDSKNKVQYLLSGKRSVIWVFSLSI